MFPMVDYVGGTCQNQNPLTSSSKGFMMKLHLHYDFVNPFDGCTLHNPMGDCVREQCQNNTSTTNSLQ